MKNTSFLLLCGLSLMSTNASAFTLDVFKNEDGSTKWQYIANFTGSVLIVLLTVTLLSLLVSQYKLRVRNNELKAIRLDLEKKVQKRTEKLNASNELLKESNQKLEGEIAQHKETASALLSSQNYMRSILASMPSTLIGLDEELKITHWNRTATEITGIDEEAVLGQYLWEAYATITVSPEQVSKVLEGGEPISIKHSQRGQYYFDITVYPLAENRRGVVLIIENVTQRSLAENMLIQRDKMASMGELASSMAHDIDIPLQGILEDVQSVRQSVEATDTLPPNALSLLKDAVSRCKQAAAVVNNLLDFANSHGSEKHPANIIEIIDHCILLAENVISDPSGVRFKDIELLKSYASEKYEISCYAAELQQVFLSLFRHACLSMTEKRADDYRPRISIEVFNAYDSLWVKVQHNGNGLSPDEQQDLFEPIGHYATPTNPKPPSSINRLSFSYFIITEHHQGEMAVTSDPGVGTTFHIQFYSEK